MLAHDGFSLQCPLWVACFSSYNYINSIHHSTHKTMAYIIAWKWTANKLCWMSSFNVVIFIIRKYEILSGTCNRRKNHINLKFHVFYNYFSYCCPKRGKFLIEFIVWRSISILWLNYTLVRWLKFSEKKGKCVHFYSAVI